MSFQLRSEIMSPYEIFYILEYKLPALMKETKSF